MGKQIPEQGLNSIPSMVTPKNTIGKTNRSSIKAILGQFLFKTGFLRAVQRLQPNSLTVLNYHRIGYPSASDFDTFKPNISGTPEGFEQQMNLVSRWFNVISVEELAAWLDGKGTLPSYPALITFDDGYLDNYLQAFPILQTYHFPALIFLTVEHIAENTPFYWDLIAYCFHHTEYDHISLPLLGDQHWANTTERDRVVQKFTEALKQLPQETIKDAALLLPEQLGVHISQNTFENMMMNWDQIRELSELGIEFGGHTLTHPILTRIPNEQASMEIDGSKRRIQAEISREVISFAYPNGQAGDFDAQTKKMVSQAGYQLAFTLVDGPNSFKRIKQEPLEIRRIFISHKDTLSRFAIKICGINRMGIVG